MIQTFTDATNLKLGGIHFNFKATDACLLNGYGMQALNSFFVLPYLEFQRQELENELDHISKTLTAANGIRLEAEKGGDDGWGQRWMSFSDLEKERVSEEMRDKRSFDSDVGETGSNSSVNQSSFPLESIPAKDEISLESRESGLKYSLNEKESDLHIEQERLEGRRTIMSKENWRGLLPKMLRWAWQWTWWGTTLTFGEGTPKA